jgi:hypothetical protein
MTRARGPDATQPMPKAIVSADLQRNGDTSRMHRNRFKKGRVCSPTASKPAAEAITPRVAH